MQALAGAAGSAPSAVPWPSALPMRAMYIGWTQAGIADAVEVQAYVKDSSIDALGGLSLTADGDATISASVAAARWPWSR